MILIDFSAVFIGCLMQSVEHNPHIQISEDLTRHFVLNSLATHRKKFKREYGDLVLAADGTNYWRKKVFPYYKGTRKKTRAKSGFNWDQIFLVLNTIKEEMKQHFPYKVVQVDEAEADDVIATLCKYASEPVLIISRDNDFLQLQKYPLVRQYAPTERRFLTTNNPEMFLKEKIIRGDDGDGIPNILSADDVMISADKCQTRMMTKKVDIWINEEPGHFSKVDEQKQKIMETNYRRNETLIDFDKIPMEIEEQIMKEFETVKTGDRKKLWSYFCAHNLVNLTQKLNDF